MAKKILIATGPQTGKQILRLEAEGDQVRLEVASSADVRDELLLMIRDGLVEESPREDGWTQRTTPSSDPAFLERLAGVLQREFAFRTEIQDAPPGSLEA